MNVNICMEDGLPVEQYPMTHLFLSQPHNLILQSKKSILHYYIYYLHGWSVTSVSLKVKCILGQMPAYCTNVIRIERSWDLVISKAVKQNVIDWMQSSSAILLSDSIYLRWWYKELECYSLVTAGTVSHQTPASFPIFMNEDSCKPRNKLHPVSIIYK